VDIRAIRETDADAAARLTPTWSLDSYAAVARGEFPDRLCLVSAGDPLNGLILCSVVPPDAEILNLMVREDSRRRGIGSALVRAALQESARRGARRMRLEVRESNKSALHIYEAAGFVHAGRRAEYYAILGKKAEDALVLETTLTSMLA
jgi:ribosomal-protein-alanine N-acetyltransferase